MEGKKKLTYQFENAHERENFCLQVRQMKTLHSQETDVDNLSVFIGTWNMGKHNPCLLFFFLLNHDLSICLKAFKCSLFIKPLHHSPHCYSPSLTNLPFRSLSLWVVYDPCLIIFSYKFQLKWAHKQNCFFQESRLLLTPSSSGYAAGGRGKAKIGHCPGYHMTYM